MQVPPAAIELVHVLLVNFGKIDPLLFSPEEDGVTATEFGVLNVVVFDEPFVTELVTVNAAMDGATVIVMGTLGTLPPAEEEAVSVPLYVPATLGVVTVTDPHEPLAGQDSVDVLSEAPPFSDRVKVVGV